MTIHLINALASGAMAAIWSKTGWQNILIAMFFVCLTVANAAYSAPIILRWMGQ